MKFISNAMTNTIEIQAIFGIASAIIMSYLYFFIQDKIKSGHKPGNDHRVKMIFLWRKVSGLLILGLIPAVTALEFFQITPVQAGLTSVGSIKIWIWVVLASMFFITLNIFNSKSAALRESYPELRLTKWGVGSIALAASGWLLYLAGYEYLFRGLLLFSCYHYLGYWPAIVINLALYSALHLPKGMKEAVAAIPFGLLLCYLTLESQSILPAILIHLVQAVSCEIFCIIRNPEMHFSFKINKS